MIMALATALVDVGCNSLLFKVPEIDIAPAMSGYHFFFGLGAFLAPLVLAGSLNITNGIQWGYWGLALFSILILAQFIKLQEPVNDMPALIDDHKAGKTTLSNRTQVIWVIGMFFFAFVGVEVGFGDWLSTYSVKAGLTDEKAAILLTSIYWGAFTISRLISIPLAARLKPRKILLVDLSGAILGLGLIYLFPERTVFLWLGTIVLGFSVASLFPTMLTFADGLLSMTGRVTSIFFISGSMGSILLPWLIGRFVEDIGPRFIIQVLYLTLLLAAVIFVILMQVSKKKPQ
jgi:FHS family Na+ dependent glucose MFS transporter 1